ncbi:MAG: DUF5606 domain-containing protein [Alloprevotella sp.]|nr:DUF5606 domain-containing protein [Alloprevotella sp.]
MLRTILSIAGRPGLFRLVSQGKNMLIVEGLADHRRAPAYAHDKVISLGDISIYTMAEDMPLAQVLEAIKAKVDGAPVDIKAIGDGQALRDFFGEVVPEFDHDRVHTSDIRKILQWYNLLLAADVTDFVKKDEDEILADEKTEDEAADAAMAAE